MSVTKCIFFDLDGTLTDSGPGLIESFTYIFQKYGKSLDGVDLRYLVGPPIIQALEPYFDSNEQLMAALGEFRVHYSERMLTGNSLYSGVVEMLRALKSMGYVLGIVTGKPQDSAEAVVEYFNIREYFDGVYGTLNRGKTTEKIETLRRALELHNCDPAQAVMIGDRMFDLEAAALGGTDGIGVLWGYGEREELSRYNCLLLASNPMEIVEHFRT